MERGPLVVAICALAVIAVSGCGGSGDSTPAAIPPSLARSLASGSEEIAELLDSGETCEAAGKADELHDQAENAVTASRVSGAVADDLTQATSSLVNDVGCVATPTLVAPEEEKKEKKRGKSKAPSRQSSPSRSSGQGGDKQSSPPSAAEETAPDPEPTEAGSTDGGSTDSGTSSNTSGLSSPEAAG